MAEDAARKRKKRRGRGRKKDSLNPQKMAAQYGFALAFLNSDPELKKLFQIAVKNTWTPDRFVAGLRNTKWFKTHSAPVRNAIMMQTSDPKSYAENVSKMTAQVREVWGRTYGMDALSSIDAADMKKWGELAFRMGWTEEQLLDQMGASINYQQLLASKTLGGTAAEARSQLRELTSNYGIDPGDTWMAKNLERILEGDDSMEGAQARVRDLAKQQYAAFADEIDGGRTVAEIADPYRQKMADLLELNPNDITLKDNMIQKALTAKDQEGNPAAQTLTDFANMVRKDSRWAYTNNAKQNVAETTTQLLRSFGLSV